MICKSCGAKYDKTNLKCPYCNSENMALAKKRKKELLASYDAEAREMETTVPKQAVKKWTRQLVKILPVIIIIVVVVTVAAIVWGRVSAAVEYNAKQKHLEKMEAFFQTGKWEELDEYYHAHDDIYGSEFEKYREILQAYSWFEMFLEDMEELEKLENITFTSEDSKQELYLDWIDLTLRNAQEVLSACVTCSEDNSFKGNEKELEKVYSECAGILMVFGYSEEEIECLARDADSQYYEELKERMLVYYLER